MPRKILVPYAVIIDDLDNLRVPELLVFRISENRTSTTEQVIEPVRLVGRQIHKISRILAVVVDEIHKLFLLSGVVLLDVRSAYCLETTLL